MVSMAVDRQGNSIDPATALKAPCRVATTANLTLSGLQTVNGVALAANDRVLVKDQTDSTKNGIYAASATAWARAKDFNGNRDCVTGTMVWTSEGSANPGTFYRLTTANPVVIDISSIGFVALDVFAALLPQTLTALDMPRVNSGATAYELRTPAQVATDIGAMKASNNLSDVSSAPTSRTNLGLGSIATQSAGAVAITGGSIDSATLTSLPSPSGSADAATKGYVDSALAGLGKRGAVRAASTANVASLSGTTTVDGVALIAGDLVLLKDQSTQANNGVYAIASGAWSRDTNYDTWNELTGALIVVEEGSTQADFLYLCTSVSGGTLGTTAVTFSKVAPGSGGTVTNITASNGVKTTSGLAITNTGNVELDIVGLSNKATPAVADKVPMRDVAGSANVWSTWTQILAAIFGTAATVNTGTSGATLGLNNGANTISGVETHTAVVIGSIVTLTDGASVTPDLATGNNFFWLIGGNRTLAVPANPVAGTSFEIDVRQDITGSRTLTAAWIYTWAGGTAGVLSTPGCSFDRLFGTVAYYGTSVVTMTIAAPGVVTWTGHGLHTGCRLQLTTTGALPTGLTASTTYFVTKIDANTFKLSTSLANCAAGTFITTTGSQSGVHTAVAGDIGLALNKAFA